MSRRQPSPPSPVCELLERLSDLSNVDTTIISGRSRDDLEASFAAYPFHLIAEYGASRRQPSALIWEQLDAGARAPRAVQSSARPRSKAETNSSSKKGL